MELELAIKLIHHNSIQRPAISAWADLGCGNGLFTNALASLLARGSTIYAIDKNQNSLNAILLPPAVTVEKIKADFIAETLNVPPLDGILLANALHFVKDKTSFIRKIRTYIKPKAKVLIIEYDITVSNPYVPFPISWQSLKDLFYQQGCEAIHKIQETPSIYHHANIYAAIISL